MLTAWGSAAILDPVSAALVNAACDKAPYGWPCDERIESLRAAFAREPDAARRKEIAEQVQLRESESPTYIALGQYYQPFAMSRRIRDILQAPVTLFWNLRKDPSR